MLLAFAGSLCVSRKPGAVGSNLSTSFRVPKSGSILVKPPEVDDELDVLDELELDEPLELDELLLPEDELEALVDELVDELDRLYRKNQS